VSTYHYLARGDVLSHDLLTPHINLRDVAKTSAINDSMSDKEPSESDLPSFLNYVSALLEQRTSNSGLLSPTTPISPSLRRTSSIAEPATSKDAIDLAILRSNQSLSHQKFSTRFSISRSSRPVATLLLSRTAYRLGETIHLIIDLSSQPSPQPPTTSTPPQTPEAQIPVYAVLVTLETHETIDPAIAMRSPQSIARYTRKVHAQFAESAHFARRLSFGLPVPPNATPGFGTSGVGLEWRIRVEFVTPQLRVLAAQSQEREEGEDAEDEDGEEKAMVEEEEVEWQEKEWEDLLEEVASDDRGAVLHGVESLPVETFEVCVPVRVYGVVLGGRGESDKKDLVI
jgi:RAB6A-GEF complex partner protein 2